MRNMNFYRPISIEMPESFWDAIQMAIIDNLEEHPPWDAETKEEELVCDRLMDALRKIRYALDHADD